ncbi:MAG: hypothetical protein Q9202_007372 [Teloschistes flavicans]
MEAQSENRLFKTKRLVKDRFRTVSSQFRNSQEYNLKTFRRQPLQESSGSFGDLGTLLPILIAYTADDRYRGSAIDLSSTLVFTGIFNIINGLIFGIPLPVQPMKAIAAVALSDYFNKEEVASAGLFVAAVVGFLSVTGLLEWFNRRIPVPVVKGIQVGVGLSLITYGGGVFIKPEQFQYEYPALASLLRIFTVIGLLGTTTFQKVPYALILLVLGILFAIPNLIDHSTAPSVWQPHVSLPSTHDFQRGIDAGLGQIPLTVLNSIIAVCALSADLLPDRPTPSTSAIGFSVAAMNLLSCWFGSMPVCHGSGGLAAQYRFGARSGASIIFLGLIKLLLGLFLGRFTKQVFRGIPNSVLGIMVIAAGIELANVGESLNTIGAKDLAKAEDHLNISSQGQDRTEQGHNLTIAQRRRRWTTMLVTVGGILAFKNDAVGFLAGMLWHWSYLLHDRYISWRSQSEGTIRLGDDSASRL